MASIVLTPAVGVALSLDDVHKQCRIDVSDEDSYLEDILVPAVCALFETETRCKLLSTAMEDRVPCWPRSSRIDLGWGPVSAVSAVQYLDTAGQIQALPPEAYQVDTLAQPGAVHVAPGASLPSMQQHPGALRVQYTAGFGADATSIPRDVRLWLLLHVGHFWVNREATTLTELKPLPYAEGLIAEFRRIPI